MRELTELIVITDSRDFLEALRPIIAPVADISHCDSGAATTRLRNAHFDIALVDASAPGRIASIAARLFLYHNPTGRVAVVGGSSDTSTVISMAARDARVEVFFDPIDLEIVRQWTYAAVEAASDVAACV